MAKRHTTILVDDEVVIKARSMGINISQEIRDYLKKLVEVRDHDVEGINIELAKIEQDKRIKQLNTITSELKYYENQIIRYNEIQEEKKKQELEQQKKEVERLSKCANCGNMLQEKAKKYKMPIGHICNACFMVATGDDYRRWNSKPAE